MLTLHAYFTALTLDTRQWADHRDYYTYGPTRCPLHVPLCFASATRYRAPWLPARVGCHWTNPAIPKAVVSTISAPDFSGYVAVVNFEEIGRFATKALACKAVERLVA